MKILVVVESPGKIDKLQKILDSQNDNNEYVLVASCGHILSLNKEKTLGVDIENGYKPDYVPYPGKEHIIAKLRKFYKVCDAIWIASDMDQEGEFIGYSICSVLNLDYTKIPRLLFDAIDKTTILNAVKNKTVLNQKILDAQQCRRIMDRLIGFKISAAAATVNANLTVGRVQTIMVKLIIDREKEMKEFETSSQYIVQGCFRNGGDNEDGSADGNDGDDKNEKLVEAKLDTTFKTLNEVRAFMQDCIKAKKCAVGAMSTKISTRNPPEPLTTTTLQSLVSHRMGIPPKRVLAIAQNLYQRGVISYPRTDCPRLPAEKMKECESYIVSQYGEGYHKARVYASKDAADQEAHSCIYPTDISMRELAGKPNAGGNANGGESVDASENDMNGDGDGDGDGDVDKKYDGTWSEQDKRVYNYIWLYALSSQMTASKTEVTTINIMLDNRPEKFIADYHKLVFPGYEKLWGKTQAFLDTGDETMVTEDNGVKKIKNLAILSLQNGDVLTMERLNGEQKLIKGPTPYTQADLIKKMKTLGVGRPSTLGEILSDIMEKKFIIRTTPAGKKTNINVLNWKKMDVNINEEMHTKDTIVVESKEIVVGNYSNRLYSTELGRAIDDFVDKFFPEVFNYTFTRDLQTDMDKIEIGEQKWVQVVDKLYKQFEPKLAQFPRYRTRKDGANPGWKPKRLLGVGGGDGKNLYVFLAKYGQVIQIGEDSDKDKKYVKLPLEFNLDTITIEEAQKIINVPIPMSLGVLPSAGEVVIKKGKFGLYVWTKAKNHKLTKEMFSEFDEALPMEEQLAFVTLDTFANAISEEEKKKAETVSGQDDGNRTIGKIKIINGKFGPYFVWKNKNISIPKTCKIETITETELLSLAENKLANPSKFRKYAKKKD